MRDSRGGDPADSGWCCAVSCSLSCWQSGWWITLLYIYIYE